MQKGSDRPKRSAFASPVQWVIWSLRLNWLERSYKVKGLCRLPSGGAERSVKCGRGTKACDRGSRAYEEALRRLIIRRNLPDDERRKPYSNESFGICSRCMSKSTASKWKPGYPALLSFPSYDADEIAKTVEGATVVELLQRKNQLLHFSSKLLSTWPQRSHSQFSRIAVFTLEQGWLAGPRRFQEESPLLIARLDCFPNLQATKPRRHQQFSMFLGGKPHNHDLPSNFA